MKKLLVLLAIALVLVGAGVAVSVGITLELPALPVSTLPTLAPTAAPTPWTGDSAPATRIACDPAPCDCWPEC